MYYYLYRIAVSVFNYRYGLRILSEYFYQPSGILVLRILSEYFYQPSGFLFCAFYQNIFYQPSGVKLFLTQGSGINCIIVQVDTG
eukprot:SAG11_NODE_531_length_8710_cov_33.573569_3_plen_85_part_00